MFAALRAPSCPVTALTAVAQDFTPRFEVIGAIVVLDVSGLARLFGGPDEIGDYLFRAAAARASTARVAIAPTATAAMLLVLGRPGLSVIASSEMVPALAALPLSVLGAYERVRREHAEPELTHQNSAHGEARADAPSLLRGEGGWQHPRHTHQAGHARRSAPRLSSAPSPELARRAEAGAAPVSASSAPSAALVSASSPPSRPSGRFGETSPKLARRAEAGASLRSSSSASQRVKREAIDVQATLDLLGRWGLTTLGALTALPTADVSERLGERGTRWQRLARGEDERPLVPWVPEEPFEASLDLEWPIEGLEPLSFVLTRLLEPLSERLARADRGAAIIHTRLRLVDKTMYARQVQLPSPMRDPKTLRTLMLLDLESHPPTAAVDRVGVLIEPTPGRVLQWTLFERAQPSPEQVSTLLARLTALMGEGHVGSPALVDSWKPGSFQLQAFAVQSAAQPPAPFEHLHAVVRRFRLPVPARVRVDEGRPVRVQVDRRGLASGAIVQAAGPWRTSGQWWEEGQVGQVSQVGQVGQVGQVKERRAERSSHPPHPTYPTDPTHQTYPTDLPHPPWDRDEWDVSLGDGTIYRLFVERAIGQWFIEGVID